MKKSLITLPLFLFASLFLHAQNNSGQILSMEIRTSSIDTTADGMPANPSSTVYHTSMVLSLTDLTTILKINVKLGTADSSGNLLTKTFDFDVFGDTGGGTSYNRVGDDVILGLGDFSGLTRYFSSVQAEQTDHNFTDWIPFNR